MKAKNKVTINRVRNKDFTGSFALVKDFGSIQFRVVQSRDRVCESIVVGKRLVEEKIIPATPEQKIPAHEEDIVEWHCAEPLLTESAQEVSNG